MAGAADRERLDRLFRRVVEAAYEVSNVLGTGFLEKVYEKALARELEARGLKVETQVPLPVRYKGAVVGDYFADLLVEGELIVELKCVENFSDEHLAQCLNYLKATGLHLAVLLNFRHPKVLYKRVVREF